MCKCFRAGEVGHHHQPEFTMLEWYRAWDDLDAIARDTEQLVAHVATAVNGRPQVTVQGKQLAVDGPWLRLTVAEAMYDHAKVAVRGDESVAELTEAVRAAGIDPGTARHWDDVFFTAFVERVNLTFRQSVAALSRRTWAYAQTERHLRLHCEWFRLYYHLVRAHESLAREVPGLKRRFRPRSPAMALDLTDHLWSVHDLLHHPVPQVN